MSVASYVSNISARQRVPCDQNMPLAATKTVQHHFVQCGFLVALLLW